MGLILGEGHDFKSLQVKEHLLHKTLLWLYEKWGIFQNDCIITTTMSSQPTTSDSSTPDDNGTSHLSYTNYLTAACILFGMHIFTLTIWVHLKI